MERDDGADVRLQPGDVVRFDRGEYAHVALYVGDGRVAHLWSPDARSSFRVRVDPMRAVAATLGDAASAPECFSEQMDARMGDAEPLPGDEVVRRALSRLGACEYDYLAYNCEHFVTWARYGAEASPQVASQANRVFAGALLGAAVGGLAGFVVGGVLSLVLRADALAASVAASSGAAGGASAVASADAADEERVSEVERDEDSDTRASDSEDESARPGGGHVGDAQRAAERARLWAEMDAIRPATALRAQSDDLTQLDEWVEERRRRAAAASSRRYSTARHVALATRLAEDELHCGICFTDLLRVRAVVFSCDHFTCGVCFDALRENADGLKSCPYCRLDVSAVEEIHKSTKMRARSSLQESYASQ